MIGGTQKSSPQYHVERELFANVSKYECTQNSIMDAYINMYSIVEKTGGHSQFYDKFNYRHGILSVMVKLLKGMNAEHYFKKMV